MAHPPASERPRNGRRRDPLSDALLLRADAGTISDTIVPQLRARVSQKGVVSFQVDYWSRPLARARTYTIGRWAPEIGGRRPGVSVPAARRAAADVLARARLGQDPQQERVAGRRGSTSARAGLTVRQLAAAVLARLKRRPTTLRGYRSALDVHALPRLGDLPAASITRQQVRQLVVDLARRHPYQANRVLGALRRIYSLGLEADLVQASPCVGIRAPGSEHARERVYSREELQAIWRGLLGLESLPDPPDDAASEVDPGHVSARQLRAHARAHRLALLTGVRRGEVYGARVAEIDLEARLWRLPAARMKAGRPHTVPLSDPAVELLQSALGEARRGWLWPGGYGHGVRRPGECGLRPSTKATALLRAATVPDLRMHDLRRTVATACAEAGVPGLVVAALLGHRLPVPGATAHYLQHDYLAERRAALDAWGDRLRNISDSD